MKKILLSGIFFTEKPVHLFKQISLVFIFISFFSLSSFAQAPHIKIWVECVKPLENGKFKAFFGYNNPGDYYKVPSSKSVLVYNGSQQKWDAINEFQTGTHTFVVERELEGNDRVKWRLTLPKGNVQEVIANSQSNVCPVPDLQLVQISSPATTLSAGEYASFVFSLSNSVEGFETILNDMQIIDSNNSDIAYLIGDSNGDGLLQTSEDWHYSLIYLVKKSDVSPYNGSLSFTTAEIAGTSYTASIDYSFTINATPLLTLNVEGPFTAYYGQRAEFSYTVSHDPAGDYSDIIGLELVSSLGEETSYVDGDDGDAVLEYGEIWTYASSYRIKSDDPATLLNMASATATDIDGESVPLVSTSHSVDIWVQDWKL